MTVDSGGSYLREPSVSERALQLKLEALATALPLNDKAMIERSTAFDESLSDDIDFYRSKKELEASLDHRIDQGLSVKLRYNPAWNEFVAREVTFPLPGTSAISARLELSPDSSSYDSSLYDESTGVEISRNPVQLTTISTLLAKAGVSQRIPGAGQNLADEVFAGAKPGEKLTVSQAAVLQENELEGDIQGVTTVSRDQIYSDEDIVDIVRLVDEIHTGDTSHARIISSIRSQDGSTITVEQVSINHETGRETRRMIELDYETLEKLIAHVQSTINQVG